MEKDKPGVAVKLFAGGLAGASETMITYPVEFLKTRRQLPQNRDSKMISIIKSTYRNSGIFGFYSGCRALVASNVLKSGVRFCSFEATRDYLDKKLGTKEGRRSPWVSVMAGFSAGVVESLLVVTPGETLKTRLIEDASSERRQFAGKGLAATATAIVRAEGVRTLWRGAIPVLSKQATNSAVRFTSFGVMQEQVARRWPSVNGHIGVTLIMGALSGVLTVYASMPFDNLKTRMQMHKAEETRTLRYAALILKNEGIRAFWRGTTPRLVRLTLSSSITFTVYDQVVRVARGFQRRPYTELRTV